MATLATDFGNLHFEDQGRGPPLLLLHGWSLSSSVFADELPFLARTRRVVAPDLRGHGRSSAAGPFSLADLAGDVVELAGRLALDRLALAGWSLGAQVALASLPLLRPRVAALVLVSGTPRFVAGDGWPHGLPASRLAALARRVGRDPAGAVGGFFEGMFAEEEAGEAVRARAEALRSDIPTPDPASALAGLDLLAREDLRARLPAVDVPTLLIHGERDPICPVGASRAMSAAIPGARLVELPGAGHAPFLSRPGAFRDALSSFLAAIA